MKIQMEIVNKRLEFLYDKLEEIDDEFPLQRNYLLSEIDKNMAMLLELEVEQEYQEIEQPDHITNTIKDLED